MAARESARLSLQAAGGPGRAGQGSGAPLSGHSGSRPRDRPDPVALLEAQNLTQEPDLVPVRHGRMMVSPFTFYRGAAKIMAADYADQNERDFEDFIKASLSGRLEAVEGV